MSKRITPFLELADTELVAKLGELKEELFNLRFQAATGVLENTARLGVLKRDVARVNTVLRTREIAAADSLAAGKK